jgi:crotonobetainyl-CoA:carnitine CoA-transferase CaiB-like acyl-CoA transferase
MDRWLPARLLDLDPAGAQITGPSDVLATRYEVTGLLTSAVATAGLAAAEWRVAQGLGRPTIGVDTRAAAAAGSSIAFARVGGRSVSEWGPLSGFARAADGWVRLHANYDHHRDALCAVLDIPPERPALDAAVGHWGARDLEMVLAEAGGAGVAVRTAQEWAETSQGQAVSAAPLVSVKERGSGRSTVRSPRVFDLTRVLAGPVGTRMLGLLGADVLRLDRPDRPEQDLFVDTGLAKRSALVDLRTYDPEPLVAQADVIVIGYRPGSLRPLHEIIDRYPQLVVVELCAWGFEGPWRERRGFDSLVQAASGVSVGCGSAEKPAALPVQALDHATGYLVAACAWHGLARRAADGRGRRYRLALSQTAAWLGEPRENPCGVADLQPVLQNMTGGYGETTVLGAPITLDGNVPPWPSAAERPGTSHPKWRNGAGDG